LAFVAKEFDSVEVKKFVVLSLANLTAKRIFENRILFIVTKAIGLFVHIYQPGTDAAPGFAFIAFRHE
jgi:hypothetical protein